MTPPTVLIGLDGATFTVLDALVQDGVMPFLGQFMEAGVRAELRTVIPALTPPAWTSLVTGRSPGQHGIFDFFRRVSPQSHDLRFVTSRDVVGGESIWSLANRHGLRAMALNFPLTFPPPPIDGYIVPGWMPWRQLRLGCHPDGLYDRLKTLPGFNPRELAMDMAHEEKALEGCERDEYEAWVALHARREQRWFQILEMLLHEGACELITMLFDGIDKLQHLLWRFIDPAYAPMIESPWERRVRDSCLDYFRQLDGLLARIAQLAGPEATVIMASDHGFGPQVRTFFVNAWLAERGYLAWVNGDGPRPSNTQLLGVGQIARHSYLLDWERTQAYAPLPSGNGIHIVRADERHPHGVPEPDYEQLRNQLIAELHELRDPASGVPVVAQVWKREEIFAGPCLELAPDLTLVLQDGGLISIMASDAAVSPRLQPSGTHRPEGIFIARGPALRRGICLSQLSILDMAPLILYSLGLPIPTDLEGQVPLDALQPAVLQARPVETVGLSRQPGGERLVSETEFGLNDEAEMELLRRLRNLGYVE